MKARRTLSSILVMVIAALSLATCGAEPMPTPVPTPTSGPTATPSESPTATPTPTPLPVVDIMVIKGQPFNMGPKHRAFVNAEGYTIDYLGVVSDSRCARDVQCITAGRAVVEFAIRLSTVQTVVPYLFGIGDAGPEPSEHTLGGYRVTLTALDPLPHSDGRPLDYRATLVVTSAR